MFLTYQAAEFKVWPSLDAEIWTRSNCSQDRYKSILAHCAAIAGKPVTLVESGPGGVNVRDADGDFGPLNHPPASTISKVNYDLLRAQTPTPALRDMVNDGSGPKADPVYGYEVERLQADHLVSMKEIAGSAPGFSLLTPNQQLWLLNFRNNFIGLGGRTNASKGAKAIEEWKGHSKLGPVPTELREQLTQRAKEIREALRNEALEMYRNPKREIED